MLPQELESIIEKGEGQTVDFKESGILSDAFKLARLMAAFANNMHVSTKHGGLILIGVRDDGKLERLRANSRHEEHLMNIARDKCVPSIIPQFEVVNLNEGDVYVLTIPKMTKHPFAVRLQDCNAYYVRVGTTVRVATPEELQELFAGSGRPAINQVIQGVRESLPSFFSGPYRSVLIAPEYVVKNLVQFDAESERWLSNNANHSLLKFGDPVPTQDGLAFEFGQVAKHEYFAKVTREGVIYYREAVHESRGTNGGIGIHIGLTIGVIGEMLEYAQKVYEHFGYKGSCVLKLEAGNIRGAPLILDFPFSSLRDYRYDGGGVLMVEREPSWVDMTQNRASVVASVIVELCRSFRFSITEKEAAELVERRLKPPVKK